MSGHAHDEAAAVRALAVVEQFVCLPFPLTAEERSEWMTAKGRALGAIEAARLTVDTPGQPEQATAESGDGTAVRVEEGRNV